MSHISGSPTGGICPRLVVNLWELIRIRVALLALSRKVIAENRGER